MSHRNFTAILLVIALLLSSAACDPGKPSGPTQTPVVLVVTATPAKAAEPPASQPAAAQPAAAQPGASQPEKAPATTEALKPAVKSAEPTPAETLKKATEPTAAPKSPGDTLKTILPPTKATPGSTPGTSTPPAEVKAGSPVSTEVSALYVKSDGRSYSGGLSRVRVNVERATAREVRVGFYEEEVGGSGAQWRAAGWMAVIMSSFLLGVDPTEYRYTYDVGGYIDGPSAGAMMTVATIASVLGHQVKKDAVMTGTINPDGTIGPVGGIPHKIDGAGAAKKTLALIPMGQRNDMDGNTNRSVDVIDRGRRLGVEVKEVSDIYEAYELLTGKPLPKPDGMKEARPELPTVTYDRTKSKAREWYSRYWQLRQQYLALPQNVRIDNSEQGIKNADRDGDRADALYGQGLVGAAYRKAVDATLKASIAYNTAKVVEAYVNGGVRGATSYLKSVESALIKVDALVDRLQTQRASTLSDIVALSESYGYLNLAIGLVGMADSAQQRRAANDQEAVGNLAEAVLWYGIADQAVEIAKDSLDLGFGQGKGALPAQDKIQNLAEMFRKAAEANLNYFESVVLNEIAQSEGVHLDVVKSEFSGQEIGYTFAKTSLNAMAILKDRAGGDINGSIAVLGGAMNSYSMSSVLVAKYYSLGADMDEAGNIKSVANERAMIAMLDFGEKRAREYVGLATAVGTDPVQATINYEGAKVAREGTLDDKFTALGDYWMASLQGQIAGMLSGRSRVAR